MSFFQRDTSATGMEALTPDELARLLSSAGGENISREMIEADVAAGAPTTAEGKLNPLHYAAWLLREK